MVGTYARLLRFVRPYVGVLLLGIACSARLLGRALRAGLAGEAPRRRRAAPRHESVVLGLGDLLERLPGLGDGRGRRRPRPRIRRRSSRAPRAELRARLAERARESLGLILLAALVLAGGAPDRALRPDLPRRLDPRAGAGRHPAGALRQAALAARSASTTASTRGELLSRTVNDATRAHGALDLIFAEVVQNALALAIGVALLCWISWQLTLTIALVTPLIAARDRALRAPHPQGLEAPPGEPRRGDAAPGADPGGHQGDQGLPRRGRGGRALLAREPALLPAQHEGGEEPRAGAHLRRGA